MRSRHDQKRLDITETAQLKWLGMQWWDNIPIPNKKDGMNNSVAKFSGTQGKEIVIPPINEEGKRMKIKANQWAIYLRNAIV